MRRGKELAMLEQLPLLDWPRNLYGDYMTVEELMAAGEVPYKVPKIGKVNEHLKCYCGCGQLHNNGEAHVVTDHSGATSVHHVHWFKVGHKVRYLAAKPKNGVKL